MRRGRVAVASIAAGLVVLAVGGVGGCVSRSDGEPRPATTVGEPADPVYAYLTSSAVVVVHPGRDLSATGTPSGSTFTVEGTFTRGSGLRFTDDGKYVLTVDRVGDANARAIAVSAATGETRTYSCGSCRSAIPAGGSRIAWMEQTGTLMLADLSGTAEPVAQPHKMPDPAANSGLTTPRLVGYVDGVAYVDEDMAAGTSNDAGALTVLDSSGGNRRLATDGTVAQVAVSPDGKLVAYGSYANKDSCQYNETVRVAASDGASTGTDTSVLRLFDGDSVDDLWWGRDGALYATMSSWKCEHWGGGSMTLVPSSLFRLDGTTWVSVDGGPLRAVRQLSPSIRAVVDHDGTVFTEIDGQPTKVASGAVRLAAPPGVPDPGTRATGKPLPAVDPVLEPYVGLWWAWEESLTIDANYQGKYQEMGDIDTVTLVQDGDRVVAVFGRGDRYYLWVDGEGHLFLSQDRDDKDGDGWVYCDQTASDTKVCDPFWENH